jgi:catechol 2,3-dioxygenase-like lactoylglutathione lyase family enzyme
MPTSSAHNHTLSFRAKRGTCFFLLLSVFFPVAGRSQVQRPPILGISSVKIGSSVESRATDFYKNVLLAAKSAPRQSSFILATQQAVVVEPMDQTGGKYGLYEITFSTPDLRKLSDYLASQKLSSLEEERIKGQLVGLHCLDPDGHQLWFVEHRSQHAEKHPSGPHLIHAGFIVRDRADTEHFYKDILGFRPYWHGGMKDDQTDWISLQVPDGTDWVELMVNVPADADQHLRGVMNHIALGVPDIQKAREQLVKNGVHLTEEPKLGRDGKWQLNLYDPDQTRVEFMEFTPKEKPCCSEFTGPHPKP